MTSKGQITLPKAIRTRLDLRQQDRLKFTMAADGKVLMEKAGRSALDSAGSLNEYAKGEPVPLETMDAAVREKSGSDFRP